MLIRKLASTFLAGLIAASSLTGAPVAAFAQTLTRAAVRTPAASVAGFAGGGSFGLSAGPAALGMAGSAGLAGSLPVLDLPAAALRPSAAAPASAAALPGAISRTQAAAGYAIMARGSSGLAEAGRAFSGNRHVLAAAGKLGAELRGRPDASGGIFHRFFDGRTADSGSSGVGPAAATKSPRKLPLPGLNRASSKDAAPIEERAYGRSATGLSPPLSGQLDLSRYRLPWSIRFKRAAYLGAHYSLLGASLVLLYAGVGIIPAAAAAAGLALKEYWAYVTRPPAGVVSGAAAQAPEAGLGPVELRELRGLLLRLNAGEALSTADMEFVERNSPVLEEFLGWNEDAVESLVARMGADPYRTPRVWFDESSENLDFAGSIGRGLDRSGNVYVGLGFLFRPAEQVFGVLAHELAHLLFKDRGWLRDRVRMNGTGSGSLAYGMTRAAGMTVAALALSALLQGAAVVADPASLLLEAVWAGASLAAAAVGFFFGLAATRQEELRADHFSGWLTKPDWLAAYLRDQAGRSWGEAGPLEGLFETHPSFRERVARLGSMVETVPSSDRPALPASRSEYALNGSAEAAVRGVGPGLADALGETLGPGFAAEVFFPEGGDKAEAVIRLHPTDAAYPEGGFEERARNALESALKTRYPGAEVRSVTARGHGVFAWASRSPTAARLLDVLKRHPIPIRFDAALGPEGPRGAFESRGEGGAEIVVNPFVFQDASPRALLALLSHELLHYEVHRDMRRIGIDWLDLGGLEFERLAHSAGARVWKELGADPSDDFAGEFGPPGYESGFRRWARMGREEHIGFLKSHGYGRFLRLSELRSLDPAGIAAMVGSEDEPEAITKKLDALWKLYIRKARREKLWAARHGGHILHSRLRGLFGPPSDDAPASSSPWE